MRYNQFFRRPAFIGIVSTALAFFSFEPVSAESSASRTASWSLAGYLGAMTTNRADELFQPGELEYDSYNLAGFALTYDHPIGDTRWSAGFELQITRHFGSQDYFEIGLPVTVRYRPENPWLESVESFAFGLGGSHTTEVPWIEVETRGGSRRNLIYWMLEAEFRTMNPGDSWFFRIHHRSDAWGLLEPEGGSNALAIGFRRKF